MAGYNLFEHALLTGKSALQFSSAAQWLSKPCSTANLFAGLATQTATCGLVDPNNQILKHSTFCSALLMGRWAACGYPTITMGHRTAAALMSTRIRPEDATEFVCIPWPAFAVKLPGDLLAIESRGSALSAGLLLATCLDSDVINTDTPQDFETTWWSEGEKRWWWRIIADDGISAPWCDPRIFALYMGATLWGFNQSTADLATEDGGSSDRQFAHWDLQEVKELDKRSDQLSRALTLSCCLHMSQRASGIATVEERKSKFRPGDILPQYTEYEIRSNASLNLHHAVRDYIRIGGSAPTVRHLVQPHWKRVAHGPQFSLRRLQWIDAYMRGEG